MEVIAGALRATLPYFVYLLCLGLVCQLRQTHRRWLAGAQLRGIRDERERIARVLHDTYLQSVESLTLRLHACVRRMPSDSAERRDLTHLLDLTASVMREGRQQLQDLRAGPGAAGLAQALAERARLFHRDGPVRVSVLSSGTPAGLRPPVICEVYNIASEAIANAIRHAQADSVAVRLDWHGGALALSVTDDGVGIAAALLEQAGLADSGDKWGLTGMRERAALIGCRLTIRRRAEGGTAVRLLVPAP
ncbi:sensor histidine kinase [Duganella callida]|uniref:Histidine kinase domain-containing protein n=1 Tax=Duganella callida TaxID=2561932 RepID=A0A4Y9SFU1_9BURK|nr:ATP-binding protein [Duganella callida]TFW18870.1 hypothetical protein E4L98_17240 [Duganella callida]